MVIGARRHLEVTGNVLLQLQSQWLLPGHWCLDAVAKLALPAMAGTCLLSECNLRTAAKHCTDMLQETHATAWISEASQWQYIRGAKDNSVASVNKTEGSL